jgi:hypothetical protein
MVVLSVLWCLCVGKKSHIPEGVRFFYPIHSMYVASRDSCGSIVVGFFAFIVSRKTVSHIESKGNYNEVFLV